MIILLYQIKQYYKCAYLQIEENYTVKESKTIKGK